MSNKQRFQSLLKEFVSCDGPPDGIQLTKEFIKELCFRAREMFLKEPAKLELEPPIVVVGDVHGQFRDVQMIFQQQGHPESGVSYLFLGDYVDRGPFSVETITYLILLKLIYPTNVHLLRGNHESRYVNQMYGFWQSVDRRFGDPDVWEWFNTVFNCLPLCARIAKKIFCMHGGISRDIYSWNQFDSIHRPCSIPDFGLLCDLLWADPHPECKGFKHSPRGVSFIFGPRAVKEFCEKFDIELIVRAHQVVVDGYEFFAGRKLLTIFSAANYCGTFDNAGAVLVIDTNLMCRFAVRRPTDHRTCAKEKRETIGAVNTIQAKENKYFRENMGLVYTIGKKVKNKNEGQEGDEEDEGREGGRRRRRRNGTISKGSASKESTEEKNEPSDNEKLPSKPSPEEGKTANANNKVSDKAKVLVKAGSDQIASRKESSKGKKKPGNEGVSRKESSKGKNKAAMESRKESSKGKIKTAEGVSRKESSKGKNKPGIKGAFRKVNSAENKSVSRKVSSKGKKNLPSTMTAPMVRPDRR